MRVVTFRHEKEERLGFLVDDEVVIPSGWPARRGKRPTTRHRVHPRRRGDLAGSRPPDRRRAAGGTVCARGGEVGAPMRPSTLLCSGSNYSDHNSEKANTLISGKEPEFFVKTADSVVGPGEPIVYDPALTRKLNTYATGATLVPGSTDGLRLLRRKCTSTPKLCGRLNQRLLHHSGNSTSGVAESASARHAYTPQVCL
jgi:hypothetical protein